MDVRIEEQKPLTTRRLRRPQHTFNVRLRPWQIVPVCLAPVLAGETLKAANIQVRIISDPIRSSVTGWWSELFVFYVRIGDLENHEVVRAAIVDPSANMTALNSAADVRYFHAVADRPSWARECMRAVVRAYFRDEGEAWDYATLDGYPVAAIVGEDVFDSLHAASELPAEGTGDDWERQWSIYQGMRKARLTTATFEEYLAMQGVSTPPRLRETEADFRIPELVRFVRDFTYPVPTVDPTTGLVAATVQWTLAERVDRARFFSEPGWLFGVMVVRPKAYRSRHRTSASDLVLHQAQGWLPPQWDTDPHSSLIKMGSTGSSLIHGATADYWWDRRDLFLHGEQWLNVDLASPPGSAGDWSLVALPSLDGTNTKYPALTDAQALFTTTNREFVRADGIFSLRIATRLADATF
jgi:hypothetical protein